MIDWLTGRETGGRPWETRSAGPNDIKQCIGQFKKLCTCIIHFSVYE